MVLNISTFHIISLLLCYVLYRFLARLISSHRFRTFAKSHGCQDPHSISGPWPLSILEDWGRVKRMFTMEKSGEDLLDDILGEQFRDANTIHRTLLDGSTSLATIEPANMQAILATSFKDWEMGSLRINMFKPLLGNSVVASDGAFWAHSRALFRPYFNKENVNNFDHTEDAIQGVIEAIESGPTSDDRWTSEKELMPLMLDFTLETGTGFLFGKPVKSSRAVLNENPEEEAILHQFKEDFEAAENYLNYRIRLQSLYWLADGPHFRRTMSRIRAFTERFVDVAIAHVKEAADDTSATKKQQKYDLLTALATETQDRTELRDQVFGILSASRDSTAALLAWSFHCLALHPEIFQRLRATVLKTFAPGDALSISQLKECRPLQHFLSEVLRLHGPVPVNNRRAVRDTILPVGGGPDQKSPVAVKKGTIIFYSSYHMHRRADLWGPDALECRPERFQQSVTPWNYIPFSGGPRICIGQQFALTEVAAMLVRMMQKFDAIEPVNRAEMLRERKGIGLIMWPSEGVKVKFHRAS